MVKPAWLELYEAAVLETDNGVLRERVDQAEQAMAARLNELSLDDASTERAEIEKIAKALRVLREERL
jgi:hypothetical protein